MRSGTSFGSRGLSEAQSVSFQPTPSSLLLDFDFDFHIIPGDPNRKALHALPGRWG